MAGVATVNAGAGSITLTSANDFQSTVNLTGTTTQITDTNALTLGTLATGALTATSTGNLNLGSGTAASIVATSNGGAVSQTGALAVTGITSVSAGAGSITLGNAGNDFSTIGLAGSAVSVVDANALTVSTLSSAPNQAVSIVAGGQLSLPATAIDTGTANLTLTSGGTLAPGASLRGTNVALTSNGALTLANNVTALGTLGLTTTNAPILQQTGGTVLAAGTTTVSAGTGDITLAQPSNNFQGNVLLSGGAVSVRDVDNLTVTALTSGTNRPVTLIAGGSLVLPAAAIDTGTADLMLRALGGSLAINGPLSGNTITLTGTGGLALASNITTTGDQIYTSAVQLAANVTLNAGASKIDLQGGANGGGHDLALTSSNSAADAIHTGAPVVNTAKFTVTGNSTIGGNVTTTGNQTYGGPVLLGADVTLAAGAAKIDLQGAVDAAGHALGLASSNAAADAIDAHAAIVNASQLTVTGKSTLASGVSTSGAQLYTDTVTLGGTGAFSASSLSFGNGIAAGAFDLGLQSDSLSLAGPVSGSGNASLSSATQGASIGIAGGVGTYQISQAALNDFAGFAGVAIGRADGTGNITAGNLVLPANLSVKSGSGNVVFGGTVSSAAGQARDLSVATGGVTTFAGNVGGAIGGSSALGSLNVAGVTQLDADATTTGTQSFGGAASVGVDATISASALTFASSLDIGAHSVSVFSNALSIAGTASGTGAASFHLAPANAAGSIGIAGAPGTLQVSQSLFDTLAGIPSLTLGRTDSTALVTVGNLLLPADLAISNGAGNVVFTGSLDSAAGPAHDLAVTTTGTTSFAGSIGAAHALDTLAVAGTSQFGGSIVTTGAQSYGGAATLLADSTLTGPAVSFAGTVDGAHALTVNAATTKFAGAVGGTPGIDQPDDRCGRHDTARRQRLDQRCPDLQRRAAAERQCRARCEHDPSRRQRRRRPRADAERQQRRDARAGDRRGDAARRVERERPAAARRRQHRDVGGTELRRPGGARRGCLAVGLVDRLRQCRRRRFRPGAAERGQHVVRQRGGRLDRPREPDRERRRQRAACRREHRHDGRAKLFRCAAIEWRDSFDRLFAHARRRGERRDRSHAADQLAGGRRGDRRQRHAFDRADRPRAVDRRFGRRGRAADIAGPARRRQWLRRARDRAGGWQWCDQRRQSRPACRHHAAKRRRRHPARWQRRRRVRPDAEQRRDDAHRRTGRRRHGAEKPDDRQQRRGRRLERHQRRAHDLRHRRRHRQRTRRHDGRAELQRSADRDRA